MTIQQEVFTVKDKWSRIWEIERENLTLISPKTTIRFGTSRELSDDEKQEHKRMLAEYDAWKRSTPDHTTTTELPVKRHTKYCPHMSGGLACEYEAGHPGPCSMTEHAQVNYNVDRPYNATLGYYAEKQLEKEIKLTKKVARDTLREDILADIQGHPADSNAVIASRHINPKTNHAVSAEYVRGFRTPPPVQS